MIDCYADHNDNVADDDDETFRKDPAAQSESPDKRNTNQFQKVPG